MKAFLAVLAVVVMLLLGGAIYRVATSQRAEAPEAGTAVEAAPAPRAGEDDDFQRAERIQQEREEGIQRARELPRTVLPIE